MQLILVAYLIEKLKGLFGIHLSGCTNDPVLYSENSS